jgi:hypothetical protein
MNLQNGYKVIYEKAADGKRTFYASKSDAYPAADDITLASFDDADFAGKVIYEYAGEFYVSEGKLPAYDENGIPTDTKIEIEHFNDVFVKAEETSDEPVDDAGKDKSGSADSGVDNNSGDDNTSDPEDDKDLDE